MLSNLYFFVIMIFIITSALLTGARTTSFKSLSRSDKIALLRKEKVKHRAGSNSQRQQTPEENLKPATTDDVLTVGSYGRTIRAGGLEGKVGDGKYQTPEQLQNKTIELVLQAVAAVQKPATRTLPEILAAIPPSFPSKQQLAQWEADIPWIRFVRELISKACPTIGIETAGDPSKDLAFPFCITSYLYHLPEKYKKDMGARLRAVLSHRDQLGKLFDLSHGVCLPVAIAVNLQDTAFCSDVRELVLSIPSFVAMSAVVQRKEKPHYGPELAMIQIEQVQTNNETLGEGQEICCNEENASFIETRTDLEVRIKKLMTKNVFARLWKLFYGDVMKVERDHLATVWFSDPVHKWRYALGLVQWISVTGVWLAEEVNRRLNIS